MEFFSRIRNYINNGKIELFIFNFRERVLIDMANSDKLYINMFYEKIYNSLITLLQNLMRSSYKTFYY